MAQTISYEIPHRPYITKDDYAGISRPGFSVSRLSLNDDINLQQADLHVHDFHELVIVISGSGFHATEKGEYKISSGDIFLTRSGVVHGSWQCNKLEIACIMFYPEMLAFSFDMLENVQAFQTFFKTASCLTETYRFKNKFTLDYEDLNVIVEIIRQMEQEQRMKPPDWCFAMNSLFMRLMLLILRFLFAGNSTKNREILLINNIIQYINENYMDKMYPADIAMKFGLSLRTLERVLKKSYGLSPSVYIKNLRLNKSVEFLKNSNMSITKIADKTGFFDNCYFTKCFTAKFHMSPREYRKYLRSNTKSTRQW